MSCDGLEVEAENDGLGGGVSGGCRVMDLGWCVSCDGFGVSGGCRVMDWRWRQKTLTVMDWRWRQMLT